MNQYETNCIKKTCRKNKKRDTWIMKENTHEPIIEKEKYDKVQEIKLRKQVKTKVKHQFLLRDLLYCGHCKRKLQYKVYKSSDKKRFLYESSRFNCSLFYKKKCKNNIHVKEKDLNEMVKKVVVEQMDLIEKDKKIDRLTYHYKKNNENIKKIEEYKNEIEKLERKKRLFYKNKCEQYITVEKFKIEYTKAKEEIEKFQNIIKELRNEENNIQEEKTIREMVTKIDTGSFIDNVILKKIINKIEVYSNNKIEITFNL